MNSFVFRDALLGPARIFAFGKFYRSPGLLNNWMFSAFLEKFDGILREELYGIHNMFTVGSVFRLDSDKLKYNSHERVACFRFPPIRCWTENRLSECPSIPSFPSADHEIFSQRCFCFNVGEVKLWLPKIELAGRMFFHSDFLCKSAFEPNLLEYNLYILERGVDNLNVYIAPDSDIDPFIIDQKPYRDHLGWLITKEDIKKSFNSIWTCLNSEKNSSPDGYYEWDFNFYPPDSLSGVDVAVMGVMSQDEKDFLIWEIVRLEAPIKKSIKVVFHHPELKMPSNIEWCSYGFIPVYPPASCIDFEGKIITEVVYSEKRNHGAT